MNRGVKFRAWDKDNGCFIPFDSDEYIWLIQSGNIQIEALDTGWIEENGDPKEVTDLNKIDFELMQFTGLLDKNGKEIYEGDIVDGVIYKDGSIHIGLIIFDYNAWRIVTKGKSLELDLTEKLQIIGNKFENPELLEQLT